MAHSSWEASVDRPYMLDDLTATSGLYQRPHQNAIDEVGYATQRPNRSIIGHFVRSFGNGTGLKYKPGLDDGPLIGLAHGGRRTVSQRETRRFRRSIVFRAFRRCAYSLPVLILLFFGVLHVLEALVGRAHLFWNADAYGRTLAANQRPTHGPVGRTRQNPAATRDSVPIPCHSHNDYWRDVPLFDAIGWGCTSVEADVWLFDGELYVGHSAAALSENRTLESLYLSPLLEILDKANPGSTVSTSSINGIFAAQPAQTLVLLIDFKTDGRDTFEAVQQQLQPLRERGFLSYWDGKTMSSRAVTVVGTGNAPPESILGNSSYRDIFLDAPLRALWEPPRGPIRHSDTLHNKDGEIDYGTAMSLPPDVDADADLAGMDPGSFNTSTSYYASTSFARAVGFVWRGHLSPRQMNIIRGQIRGAKMRGLKARYWDTPAWPTALRNHVWHVLVKEGADVLSVDDLKAAASQDWTVPVRDWLL